MNLEGAKYLASEIMEILIKNNNKGIDYVILHGRYIKLMMLIID
jgi:hypothetical protein